MYRIFLLKGAYFGDVAVPTVGVVGVADLREGGGVPGWARGPPGPVRAAGEDGVGDGVAAFGEGGGLDLAHGWLCGCRDFLCDFCM